MRAGERAGERVREVGAGVPGKSVTRKLRPVYAKDRGTLRVETKKTYDGHDNQTLGAHGLGDAGLHSEKNDGSE